MRVAVGGKHLEHAILEFQDGNVERAAAQVVNRNRAAIPLVEAVGQRRRSRLVDDAQHFESGEPARIAGGRALRVVEVRRHGNHGAIDFEVELTLLAEVLLGAMLQFLEDERGDLGRRVLAPADRQAHDAAGLAADAQPQKRRVVAHVVHVAAHEPLHGVDAAGRRGQQATLCLATDEHRAILVERDNRRHQRVSGRITDHHRPLVAHVGDEAVGGAEIDADDFTHVLRRGRGPSTVSGGAEAPSHADLRFPRPEAPAPSVRLEFTRSLLCAPSRDRSTPAGC